MTERQAPMRGLIGDRFRKWLAGRSRRQSDCAPAEAPGHAPQTAEETTPRPDGREAEEIQDEKEVKPTEEI